MSLSSFLQTVEWFQVSFYNKPSLTSVICLHTICSTWLIDKTISGATPLSKWSLEQWQWIGSPHSPNIEDWSLAIKMFNVISGNIFAKMLSVYSITPVDWAGWNWINTKPFLWLISLQYILTWPLITKWVPKSYIFSLYQYKMDLTLNNLQWLISHKTHQNQIIYI